MIANLRTPLALIAVLVAAMPAFYTRPRSLEDAVDFVVGRICDQLGVEHGLLKRWGEGQG